MKKAIKLIPLFALGFGGLIAPRLATPVLASASNVLYENDFSTSRGYIDPSNSWERATKNNTFTTGGPADGITYYEKNRNDVFMNNGELHLQHEPITDPIGTDKEPFDINSNHYSCTSVLLPDLSNVEGWNNNYTIEVDFRFTKYNAKWNNGKNNVNYLAACGFGIATRLDPTTNGAMIAKVDHLSASGTVGPSVAYCGRGTYTFTGQYTKHYGIYAIGIEGDDLLTSQTFSATVNGVLAGTTLTSVFKKDGIADFSTQSTSGTSETPKCYKEKALGQRIALQVNNCGVAINSISVKSIDLTRTFYSYDFDISNGNTFWDGWSSYTDATGLTSGGHYINNGVLKMESFHSGYNSSGTTQTQNDKKNNTLFFPGTYDNYIQDFDFTFRNVYDSTKYYAIIFNGGEDGVNTGKYNAIFFRQSGSIEFYKHTSAIFSSWSKIIQLKAASSGAFTLNTNYHVRAIFNELDITLIITGGSFENTLFIKRSFSASDFSFASGSIGFLTSSADVEFDNLRITTLLGDAEEYGASFISGITCDASGETAPSLEEWSTLKASYLALDESTKAEFINGVADIESSSYVEKALAKYEYIINKYNKNGVVYDEFIARNVASYPIYSDSLLSANTVNNISIIVIVAITGLTLCGATIFLKRKKAR